MPTRGRPPTLRREINIWWEGANRIWAGRNRVAMVQILVVSHLYNRCGRIQSIFVVRTHLGHTFFNVYNVSVNVFTLQIHVILKKTRFVKADFVPLTSDLHPPTRVWTPPTRGWPVFLGKGPPAHPNPIRFTRVWHKWYRTTVP